MAYQLIYTSYPVSLVHGRTGFSTVARSKDMPEKLASALERASVYEAASGAVFSHRIISAAGRTWHILSRVCDSGADYTNRNNYIAHHLAVSEDEVYGLPNPAEILLNWDGWLSSWNEDPKFIGNADLSGIISKTALPAKAWAETFGDSGKAALLGDSSAVVIASAQDAALLLKLYSESLMLNVKGEDAWNTSFTTSLAKSDNAADFVWKGVDEVRADFPVAGLVNLKTRTAPDAPSGRAADYARSGEMNNRERYNLHVSGPKKIEAHFNVVEARPEKDYSIWIIAACSAGATILIIAAALIFLWDSDDSGAAPRERGEPLPSLSYNAPEKPAETSVAAQASAADEKASLYEVMDAVKVKIEGGDFEEALALWDGSAFSKKDAKYREEILGDIGYRIDSLLRYADNVFILEAPGETEMSRAIRNVSLARRGLDIDGVPRKEERMAKWETLNKKIKK